MLIYSGAAISLHTCDKSRRRTDKRVENLLCCILLCLSCLSFKTPQQTQSGTVTGELGAATLVVCSRVVCISVCMCVYVCRCVLVRMNGFVFWKSGVWKDGGGGGVLKLKVKP